ncbi:MAG TPA: hypothetical protein VII53_08215, partial [Solirubrobacteraceae bacterium]
PAMPLPRRPTGRNDDAQRDGRSYERNDPEDKKTLAPDDPPAPSQVALSSPPAGGWFAGAIGWAWGRCGRHMTSR